MSITLLYSMLQLIEIGNNTSLVEVLPPTISALEGVRLTLLCRCASCGPNWTYPTSMIAQCLYESSENLRTSQDLRLCVYEQVQSVRSLEAIAANPHLFEVRMKMMQLETGDRVRYCIETYTKKK